MILRRPLTNMGFKSNWPRYRLRWQAITSGTPLRNYQYGEMFAGYVFGMKQVAISWKSAPSYPSRKVDGPLLAHHSFASYQWLVRFKANGIGDRHVSLRRWPYSIVTNMREIISENWKRQKNFARDIFMTHLQWKEQALSASSCELFFSWRVGARSKPCIGKRWWPCKQTLKDVDFVPEEMKTLDYNLSFHN